MGKRAKTIDNRFHEACNENNEPKERVYRATHGDYIFGRAMKNPIPANKETQNTVRCTEFFLFGLLRACDGI